MSEDIPTFPSSLNIPIPAWLVGRQDTLHVDDDQERMLLAIDAAQESIRRGSGGPFGAAIFDRRDGRLVALGVNLVASSGLSIAHGEVVAMSMAQAIFGVRDLSKPELGDLQLVTTAEPCAMCMGAIHWCGIRNVMIGAADEDVRTIGFDEGHKPSGWRAAWKASGIRVQEEVCRPQCVELLLSYQRSDGEIYNAGQQQES